MAARRGTQTFEALLGTIGTNLQRLRQRAGLTQASLAETLDITVEHLRGVEGGYRTPSLQLLFTASRLLEAEVAELFAPAIRAVRNPGRPRKAR